jgi:hypothetical protein
MYSINEIPTIIFEDNDNEIQDFEENNVSTFKKY